MSDVVPTAQDAEENREAWLARELKKVRKELDEAIVALASLRDHTWGAHKALDGTGVVEVEGWTLAGKAGKVAEALEEAKRDCDDSRTLTEVARKKELEAREELREARATIERQLDQLEKARASAPANLLRVEGLEQELSRACDERQGLEQTIETLTEERDALRIAVDAWIKECRRRRPNSPELLTEVRSLLLTHGETLEADGAEHVYYLHFRVSQALEGDGR